ncbi:SpoIID/LytB domain-containing protein [Rossellomorea arthrocnemi]
MRRKIAVLLVLLLTFASFSAEIIALGQTNDGVKVKLRNYLGNQKTISLDIKGEYFISGESDTKLTSNNRYYVKLEGGKLNLYQNGSKMKSYSGEFTIEPKQYGEANHFSINHKPYLGTVTFTIEGSYIRPINKLPFEDYLKGVVPGEMPASWNVEALKAQSVAARTYAMGRVNNSNFDDTISNQVYAGYDWYRNSTQAVEETKGKVLRKDGKLIGAYYSSSNGGHTESNSNYWGGTKLSYLPSKEDPYDPQIGWDLSINQKQINTSELDLIRPELWWNKTFEKSEDTTVINYIKNYLQKSGHSGDEMKIVGVPHISVAGNTLSDIGTDTGKKTNGNVTVQYFVKNKNGEFERESSNSIPENYSTVLGGDTRYHTSMEISQEGWDTSHSVVLGRGDKHVDAITGTVLAKKLSSPLLLTQSSELPPIIMEQIKELKASDIYILGGKAAISYDVDKKLTSMGYTVKRIEGSTRYDTSSKVAEEIKDFSHVFITSGNEGSPDALSIASFAAENQRPILLTDKDSLSNSVKNVLESSTVKQVTLVGGTSALSDNIEKEIRTLGISNIDRVSGLTRYETSINIAKKYDFDLENVFFAQGERFIDALPGAVLAATKSAPIVLTEKEQLPPVVKDWVKGLGLRPHVYYLGGEAAISYQAKTDIKNALLGDIKLHTFKLENSSISELRSMFGGSYFKSYHVDQVVNSQGKYIIKGKGFGHGVGMSQYGAKAMADSGRSYVDILRFYYPNTVLGN